MSTLSVTRLLDLNNNPKLVTGGFYKADSDSAVFTKTGNGTANIKAGTIVAFEDGSQVTFSTATAITMPSPSSGTDYAVWVNKDGSIQATTNFTSPPQTGSRRIE